tara:strand:+ start:214 stop:1092 length:879 start_codon:yes stop_codon:yes gene_type:complete
MKLAFFGLGAIGKPMSDRLINHGFDLNLFKRKKLNDLESKRYFVDPIEAVVDRDGLLICVTDDDAVDSVLFGENGVADSLKPNSFIIDFSTINPKNSVSIHKRLRKKKILYVDCPVSGGTEGAKNGSLSLFVGATKDECISFEPIFNVLGKSINYFDGVGKGQQVKAINQILVAGTYAAVAEAIELGKLIGLPMNQVVDALKVGAANSWPLENRSKAMLNNQHPLGFKLELHHKDLSIAIDIANSINVELPIASKVKKIESELMQSGLGELDISVLHRYISSKQNKLNNDYE